MTTDKKSERKPCTLMYLFHLTHNHDIEFQVFISNIFEKLFFKKPMLILLFFSKTPLNWMSWIITWSVFYVINYNRFWFLNERNPDNLNSCFPRYRLSQTVLKNVKKLDVIDEQKYLNLCKKKKLHNIIVLDNVTFYLILKKSRACIMRVSPQNCRWW